MGQSSVIQVWENDSKTVEEVYVGIKQLLLEKVMTVSGQSTNRVDANFLRAHSVSQLASAVASLAVYTNKLASHRLCLSFS